MAFDRSAGAHSFDDGERCAKCGMTRRKFDDTGERCTGQSPPKRELFAIPDDDETSAILKSSSHNRIALDIDASTPQGLSKAFRHGAFECLLNAEALMESNTANLTGHYIVTLHAIELGLKAFLAKNGLTADELSKKPYGHDLVALYSEAVRRGLTVAVPNIDKTLEYLNRYHNKGATLRYVFAHRRELPLCSDLLPIISALVNASR